MFDLREQEIIDEMRRKNGRNFRELGIIEIQEGGTRVAHGLGVTPVWVQCVPFKHRGVVTVGWWYYQKPDAQYIYLQAPQTGNFIVTVGG